MSDAFNNWTAKARAVPIEREIERRGLKLRGTVERCGPCPKCGGDDRFSINTNKQIFNCRGCGVGGDVIALVEHLDGVDFNAACATLTSEPRPKPNGKDRGAAPKRVTAATFEYTDESGAIVYVIERVEYRNAAGKFVLTKDGKRKKTFSQRRPDPDRPGEWIWNVDGVTKLPYNMPALVEAVAAERLVYIVEGEAKVDALAELGVVATCNAGGAGKWQAEFSNHLRGASVVLVPDNDEPGFRHINDVGASLVGIAARTRVLILPGLAPKGDIKDWLAAGGTREQIDALVESAPEWQPPPEEAPADEAKKAKGADDEQELIDELARLNALDYDRRRNEAADQIGIRRSTLDDQVNARREQQKEEEGPPPLFGHWVVEPWPEAVDADELIAALVARIKRHVIFSDDEALTVALWILLAWVHDTAAVHSPILLATSAEANSGKTTLISIVGFLVPRALMTVGISEAALFRSVEKWEPTIIIDEADVLLVENEPLRAVVNSGWTRGPSSTVVRCIGDDHEPHTFSTFCPKAVGMKGRKLQDTILSRCIIIEMKRKRPGDKAEDFEYIDDDDLAQLRRRARRWADDNSETLKGTKPVSPPGFDNRLRVNWRLMLAIADLAGGEWLAKARKAAVKLSNASDTTTIGERLLADIKRIRDEVGGDCILSAALVGRLKEDEEAPWAAWNKGKGLTQNSLAVLLGGGGGRGRGSRGGYGIYSTTVHPSRDVQGKGYKWASFEDAWSRYLYPEKAPSSSKEAE